MEKEDPVEVPPTAAPAKDPTRASSSSSPLDDTAVLNVAPLAFVPPLKAKKPRVSTRWNIYGSHVIDVDEHG